MLEQNFPKSHYKNPGITLFNSVISSFSEIWLFLQDMSDSCNFKWGGKGQVLLMGFLEKEFRQTGWGTPSSLFVEWERGRASVVWTLFRVSDSKWRSRELLGFFFECLCLRKCLAKQTKIPFHFPIVPWLYFDVPKSVLCATYQHWMTEV